MNRPVRVLCPAKVNLFLSVGELDDRGYHPIRTVFQAISLFDDLNVSADSSLADHLVTSNWSDLPADNTIVKALRFVDELARCPRLRIHVEKRIPAESGLGGGSSNAAGLLRVIHRFLPAPIDRHHLHDIAASIGMDVPFFLVGGRAVGEGYGDRLTALPDRPSQWMVVLRPAVGVSTKGAYAALDEMPREFKPLPDTEDFAPYNDFERVMPCECGDWCERLIGHGATSASLTGSGSAVYGMFASESAAQQAASALSAEWAKSYGPSENIPVWVTRTLSRAESLDIETL